MLLANWFVSTSGQVPVIVGIHVQLEQVTPVQVAAHLYYNTTYLTKG
ncbi:MAG: hypothetical protein IT213_17745 [Cytophagales bacterium]|jgi:hypothetical protein|nr:hypothetical protein [Cytophagales bacterium]HMR56158.1 hypothetical protein [Cyclobacteriaceae bacterium]HRE68354.1 hypothetical protein [Cyclobacteriaceae bacterium]